MDNLIEAIRTAIAADASNEARAEGVQACRTILVALETPAGEELKPAVVPQTVAPLSASSLPAIVAALRGVPPDQLLDFAIAKLRAKLPPGSEAPAIDSLKVPLVPLAGMRGGRS